MAADPIDMPAINAAPDLGETQIPAGTAIEPSAAPADDADSDGDGDGESIHVIEFQLAGDRYGVEACWVREVSALENLTALPCTPPFVAGIVNLRGEILSVIDLQKFFGLGDEGLFDLHQILVLESAQMSFGILARAIIGTRELSLASLELAPGGDLSAGAVPRDYILGVTACGELILDGEKLLADPRILVNERVET